MKKTAVLTAAIAAACAALAIPSAALAQSPADPLIFDSMTPADGASIAEGSTPTFDVSSSGGYPALDVEIATQPTLGQDGTLAQDFTVDDVVLLRSDAFPTQYHGTAYTARWDWTNKPGVYYYQVSSGYRIDPNTHQLVKPLGPVRKIVVTAASSPPVTPPPAPTAPTVPAPAIRLGVSEGASVVRDVLKQKFGARYPGARNVRSSYTRRNATTISYSVSWVKRGSRYSGTVKVRENAEDYTYRNTVRRR